MGIKIKNLFKSTWFKVAVVVIITVALPLAVYSVKQITKLFGRAQAVSVNLYLEPSTASMPPNTTFRLYLDPKSQSVTFVRAVLTFDRNKVRLASEVNTATQMSDIVFKTSMADANASGRMVVALAVPPSQNPPSAIFEVANFVIQAFSTVANDTVSINFDSTDTQVVESEGTAMAFTTSGASVILNPTTASTATISPAFTSTPTSGVSTTATPTTTGTPTPTSSAGVVKFNWESSLDGWVSASTNVTNVVRSTDMAKNGTGTLRANVALTYTNWSEGTVRREFTSAENWSSQGTTLVAYVYVPAVVNQTGTFNSYVYIQDANWVWHDTGTVVITPGTWNEIVWNNAPLSSIKRIGVRLATYQQAYNGAFYVDYIHIR